MGNVSRIRKSVIKGTVQKENRQGSRNLQKNNAKVGKPINGFLTSVLKPIPATRANPMFSVDNYNYVYNSAKQYAYLLGENFTLAYDSSDFEAVCDKLNTLLPDEQEVRLWIKGGRISIKIVNGLYDNILYYIPCKIIEETEGQFREILIEFFRILQHKQRLTSITNNQIFEMWEDEINNFDETYDEELDKDWVDLMNSYTKSKGKINKILSLVNSHPKYSMNAFKILINSYIPVTKTERVILRYIKKGLELLNSEKILFNYTNEPRLCNDNQAVDASNLFFIVYDNDMVVENFIEHMNCYAMDVGYEFFSSINKIINPRTKALAKADRFVTEFLKWINDFSEEENQGT